jgi:predicted Rossmann fold nucleotide-binding protein DprA/Smf involved in DNA uptake
MKYGIVGNRQGWDKDFVTWKISDIIFNDKGDEITEVEIISGGACGVDSYAKIYSAENGIHYKEFLPNPKESIPERYFNRNKKIAEECDILIAFDQKMGHSGTKNTIRYAKELNKDIVLVYSSSD